MNISCQTCKFNHSINKVHSQHSVYCIKSALQTCPSREYIDWEKEEPEFLKKEELWI
jgi:hypothetical protein